MSNPIRAYRKAHGLSLEQFGAIVGVGKSVVSKWERGIPPSPSSAIRIEEKTLGTIGRHMLRPDLWTAQPLETAAE